MTGSPSPSCSAPGLRGGLELREYTVGVDKESLQCLLFLHDDLRLDSVKELQGGDLL